MAAFSGYERYRNVQVEGTDPKGLILMLYEGAIKHLMLAKEGLAENDVRKRGENLSRSIAIISELNACLDPNVKDESIEFLRGLYGAILNELPKVSVTNDVTTIERSIAYIRRLKEIWEKTVMGKPLRSVAPAVQPNDQDSKPAEKQPGSNGYGYGGTERRRQSISV